MRNAIYQPKNFRGRDPEDVAYIYAEDPAKATYLRFCCHKQRQRRKFHYLWQQPLRRHNEFHGCKIQ